MKPSTLLLMIAFVLVGTVCFVGENIGPCIATGLLGIALAILDKK